MNKMPAFNAGTLFAFLLVLTCAAFVRIGYLTVCTDQGRLAPALLVQGNPPADKVTINFVEHHWFGGIAPLADEEERTAHVSPGLAFVTFAIAHYFDPVDQVLRWLQCALGILTVGCFFFFARRAFHNTLIATLAGLLIAFHPFWIVNTAELNDGVLASFLLGLCLMFGARAGQEGGAFTSLLFGLALAGLALVRAAFLPFAIVALLWFLWQCRRFSLGWFAGIVALLGFANGLAPWSLRNYDQFERPVPIVDSTYWHLWMGNNPHATGSTLNQATLIGALPAERKRELLDESNQAKRYNMLAHTVWSEVKEHPTETLQRRIQSAIAFLFGGGWLKDRRLADVSPAGDSIVEPPDWLSDNAELILHAALFGMLILALLGWRWSYLWRRESRLAALAAFWLPLPYLLSHAESLSGPRLPLDGVLLCFAAYALASLLPGLVRAPELNK
jgi:4-amino-4-deoxy-L-arabinose transferase-like glycosyltransferase